MAAEMVSSAVAQETVNQVVSRFKERYGHKSDGKDGDGSHQAGGRP
jgi:hypothetical protein